MNARHGTGNREIHDLARNGDREVRRRLAARDDIEAEVLYFLAEDKAPEVRLSVAANAAAPRQTHALLARDEDPDVRSGLAEKLARIAPDLSQDERDKLRLSTLESLNLLARDEITKVRQILSDALKDVADAPPEVIRKLALDGELKVAGPVLECSPVLNDKDLIEIISMGTAKGGLSAISKRRGVGEVVSDAIVASDDEQAIADLLGNDTAQIREQALDDLIERAENVELWHAPLVSRPKLSGGAAGRLARYVADNLLENLSRRDDLDNETLEAVKSMVRHRVSAESAGEGGSSGHGLDFLQIAPPLAVVKNLMEAGRLDRKVIDRALKANDYSFVLAALAVKTGLDIKIVRIIFSSQSAKGVTALAWKSDLLPKQATLIMQRMAGIAPADILDTLIDGKYSMGKKEMEWQLSYFRTRVNK